jgi:hypothetical protein
MEDDKLDQLKFKFSFTDEFGQLYEYNATECVGNLEISTSLELIVEKFKNFLIASGFSENSINEYINL